MFDTFLGLPFHPIVIHATVVIVPAASLAVALAALWPRFRAWAGWLPLLLSLASVVLVPISTSSGESLEHDVEETALLETHAEMGEGLLVWVIILAVGAALLFVIQRRERQHDDAGGSAVPRAVVIGAILVALVGAGGAAVQVARIGHSGAEAAWSDVAN